MVEPTEASSAQCFTNWNVDTIFNVLHKYQTSTTSLKKRAAPAPPSGTGRAKGVEVSTD